MARQIQQATFTVGMLKSDLRILDEIRVGDWLHVELEDDGTSRHSQGWITYYVQVGQRSGQVRIPPSDKMDVEVRWFDAPHVEGGRRKRKTPSEARRG
jgi:hypothetical protein